MLKTITLLMLLSAPTEGVTPLTLSIPEHKPELLKAYLDEPVMYIEVNAPYGDYLLAENSNEKCDNGNLYNNQRLVKWYNGKTFQCSHVLIKRKNFKVAQLLTKGD